MTRLEPVGPAWEAACAETNWLVYKLVAKPGKPGKFDKIPIDPRTNKAVSFKDAAELTFDEAHLAAGGLGPQFDIGYRPVPGSIMYGLDFDGCLDGDMAPWARKLIGRPTTWAEVSPSGTGVRMLAKRDPKRLPVQKCEAAHVGYYADGNCWFTVTLRKLEVLGGPDQVIGATALAKRILKRIEDAKAVGATRKGGVKHESSDAPHWFDQLSEQRQLEEVERMLGHLTNPKFGEYDLWLKLSFAVYSATDSGGFEIWDRWCQQLPGYDGAENAKKWDTFLSGRPERVTVGTLIQHGRQHGYEPPQEAMGGSIDPALAERIAKLADRFNEGIEKNIVEEHQEGVRAAWVWQEGDSAATLMDATFPEPRWALPDLIPEGLSVFAGKQKSGKSWWCLSLAHAGAEQGEFLGKRGSGGDVLLLALEDNPRRLQDRLRRMGLPPSARISIYTTWPTGKDGLEKLLDWIEQADNPILIIIDTVRRFTGPSPSRENSYERDVTLFSPLQRAAAAARVAVVGVTHLRKDTRGLDHWQDQITGSAGLPSVADAVFLLTRGESGAILRGTGRDLAEVEMPLSFDPQTCTWRTAAEALGVMLARVEGSEAERRVLEVLGKAKEPMSVKDIANELGRTPRAIRHLLQKTPRQRRGAATRQW